MQEQSMTDLTDTLEEAAARRLLTLLTLPKRNSGHLEKYVEGTTGLPAHACFLALLLCGGVYATVPTLKTLPDQQELAWKEVEAVLNSSSLTLKDSRYLVKRWGRATRLLRRLVFGGCLMRGEVEGV